MSNDQRSLWQRFTACFQGTSDSRFDRCLRTLGNRRDSTRKSIEDLQKSLEACRSKHRKTLTDQMGGLGQMGVSFIEINTEDVEGRLENAFDGIGFKSLLRSELSVSREDEGWWDKVLEEIKAVKAVIKEEFANAYSGDLASPTGIVIRELKALSEAVDQCRNAVCERSAELSQVEQSNTAPKKRDNSGGDHAAKTPVRFHCPHCDKVLRVKPQMAGKRANCPGCGKMLQLPTAGEVD